MFKSGHDSMREFPTPERVFALSRLIASQASDREELYQRLCMPAIHGDNSEIFRYTLNVAQELELIYERDGVYSLCVEQDVLSNYNAFRKYASFTALSRTDTIYFRTTSLYIRLAQDVLKCSSWGAVANLFNQHGMELSDNDMLGWRFWTAFFGLGYLHQNILIPNSCIRIRDVLEEQTQFQDGETVAVAHFFPWLESQCPELKAGREDTRLGLALSNGLRTLDLQGVIKLISQPDAVKWGMYILESEDINDVSHIRITR